MARILSTSQRAALKRRKNLGPRAHATLCLRLGRDSSCGERSTWGRQVPHVQRSPGKEPLISRLRGSSPAHR